MTGGAVLLTYRPLGERDDAAEIGARLAARFGRRRIVFVSHLRPERFVANRAVVALLGRGDNSAQVNRWLSDLRVAIDAGVPVALVLIDGAAQPPAQLWPTDPNVANAAVVRLSTANLDRDVASLIAILAPLFGADAADPTSAEPSSLIVARGLPIDKPPEAARAGSGSGASDLFSEPPGAGFSDFDLPDRLEDESAPFGLNDAELESLAQNRFAPRPPTPASAPAPDSAPPPPFPTSPASVRAAGPSQLPAAERTSTAALQAAPWTPPAMRPLATRMPDAAPWPTAIRPKDRGFATAPLGAAGVAASQPRSPPDPRSTKASRPRGRLWRAALGFAVVVAGVAFAYVFRDEIAAMIDPIANNLFHKPPPAS